MVASELGLRGQTGIYRLTVTATDWGTPNRTGSAVVIVHVEDYNDHNPRLSVLGGRGTTVHRPEVATILSLSLFSKILCTLHLLPQLGNFFVKCFNSYSISNSLIAGLFCQNSTVGEPVITLQTEDDDVGNNAAVDVMFVQDVSEMSDYRYFYIQPVSSSNGQFVIKQNTTFDREAKTAQYKVWMLVYSFPQ